MAGVFDSYLLSSVLACWQRSASRCIVMFGYLCRGTILYLPPTRTPSAAEITPPLQIHKPLWPTPRNSPLGVVHITNALASDNIAGSKFRYTKLSYPLWQKLPKWTTYIPTAVASEIHTLIPSINSSPSRAGLNLAALTVPRLWRSHNPRLLAYSQPGALSRESLSAQRKPPAQRKIQFVCEFKNFKPQPNILWCFKCPSGILTHSSKSL